MDRDKAAPKTFKTSQIIRRVDDVEVADAGHFYDLMKARTGKSVKLRTFQFSKEKVQILHVAGAPEFVALNKTLCNDHQDYLRRGPRNP